MAEKIKISGIKITNGKYMLTIGSVLSLFVFGLFDSLKDSTISALLGEPGSSDSMLHAEVLGGMFGPWIMGIVTDCRGIKWGMGLGSVFLAGISGLCFRISD